VSAVGWVAVASSLAFAQLFVLALRRRRQGRAVIVFAGYCLGGLVQSLVEVGFQSSGSLAHAAAWARLRACWPVMPVLLLHFAVAYAKPRLRRAHALLLAVLYASALALLLLGLTTDLLDAGIERDAWGWFQRHAAGPSPWAAAGWASTVGAITAVVLWGHWVRMRQRALRAQALLVAVGATLPIVAAMLTEALLPLSGRRVPPLTMGAVLAGSLLIGWAVRRHDLLMLSAATAADAIIAAMADALFLVDQAGTICRVNPAACRLLHLREEELVGRRFLDLVEANEAPTAPATTPVAGTFMAGAVGGGGRRIPVRVSGAVVTATSGAVIGMVVSLQDYSEIARAHEMMAMLDRAIATTRTGITIKDRAGRILYANPADVEMHGYDSVDELLGKPASIFGPAEAARPLPSAAVDSIDGLVREGFNVRRDGSRFPVRLVSDVVRNHAGVAVGLITVCEDITARRRVEEELRRSHEEARASSAALIQAEKLTALGEVAASMVHELNQPLNAIKISCQAALRAAAPDAAGPGVEDLREIVDLVNRAAEVVDHVRRFARRTEGVPHGSVDMNPVVGRAVALLAPQMEDRGIELVQTLSPGLPAVIGDPVALEQVVLNLLVNAKDALAQGRTERPRIELRTRVAPTGSDPGASVIVEVIDNGPGIAEELQRSIFEPFFTTKAAGKGTGLGLAIVRRIVEQHHGAITLTSHPGSGACFSITLPGVAALAVDQPGEVLPPGDRGRS